LAGEEAHGANDETRGDEDAEGAGQGPGALVAEDSRKCPRTGRSDHAWLQFEDPGALREVEQVDQSVKYKENAKEDYGEHA
jgi:hypothetical protein